MRVQDALSELRRHVACNVAPPSFAEFWQSTVSYPLHEWQRDYLAPILQRTADERGLRLAIHGPPGYGKSDPISKRLPAYLFGVRPDARVYIACYNETHATSFGEVLRDLLASSQYQEIFPNPESRLATPAGGGRFFTEGRKRHADAQPSFMAMGLQSGFTGKHLKQGDLLIIDDPYKSPDEADSDLINEKVWRWWTDLASNRVDPDANVILMFHRYHDTDMGARAIERGFQYIRFPAISDEDEEGTDPTGREPGLPLSPMRSLEWLLEKKELDPYVFSSQYQGKPHDEGGRLFTESSFEIVEGIPRTKHRMTYWDLATSTKDSGDWTVGVTMGVEQDGTPVVYDVIRDRLEWPDAYDVIIGNAQKNRIPIAVDRTGTQLGYLQQLARDPVLQQFEELDFEKAIMMRYSRVPLIGVNITRDKKQRASSLARRGKTHKIKLVKGDWNEVFIKEFCRFRGQDADVDDQVDASSGAFEKLSKLNNQLSEKENIVIGSHKFYERLTKTKQTENRIF